MEWYSVVVFFFPFSFFLRAIIEHVLMETNELQSHIDNRSTLCLSLCVCFDKQEPGRKNVLGMARFELLLVRTLCIWLCMGNITCWGGGLRL